MLLHGENVDVKSSHDTKVVSALALEDLEKDDLVISATPLYITPGQEFFEVNKILDVLYSRLYWKRLVYLIAREAANLFYSRLQICSDQIKAKAEAIYLIRESRYMGMAIGLDSLKYTSVDIDMRILTDYQIIKSLGRFGLPDDLKWLYSFLAPEFIRKMEKGSFAIVGNSGAIGVGYFTPIPWHKQIKENICHAVGVKVEYGEVPVHGTNRHTYQTVGGSEHREILALYIDQSQSMAKIEKLKHRSRSTIKDQIDSHNEAIARSGFCPSCQRVRGTHARQSTKAVQEVTP